MLHLCGDKIQKGQIKVKNVQPLYVLNMLTYFLTQRG